MKALRNAIKAVNKELDEYSFLQTEYYKERFQHKESKHYIISTKDIINEPEKFFPIVKEMEANDFKEKSIFLKDLISKVNTELANLNDAKKFAITRQYVLNCESIEKEMKEIHKFLTIAEKVVEGAKEYTEKSTTPNLNSASNSQPNHLELYGNFLTKLNKVEAENNLTRYPPSIEACINKVAQHMTNNLHYGNTSQKANLEEIGSSNEEAAPPIYTALTPPTVQTVTSNRFPSNNSTLTPVNGL